MLKTDEQYRALIKRVGCYGLKNTHKWRKVAIYFQKYGVYCEHVENTHDWIEFWDKEEEKIRNGVWIDGFYIPGFYYFYLNYLPIYRKQDRKHDFPDVYDMDYHTFLCLEHAIFRKEHFVVIKKRQAGFSLKFCVPIMFELWFGKGSPNYIATYEEAQVQKAWGEIISQYREHLNGHTAWYRDFNPDKMLNWQVAKEVMENGKKLLRGRKNTLKGLVLSKSPSKGVGGAATYIFADEAGVNPVLMKFIGYIKSQVYYGNQSTGTIIVSGAVGELKHLEGGLKDLISNPEAHGFYAVDNIWDKDNEFAGKKCGFFVPESWAYYGFDEEDPQCIPFVDKEGNSDVPRAEAYIRRKREEKMNKSIEAYNFEISQAPLNLMECFQYRSERVFPAHIINRQIAYLEDPVDPKLGKFVRLFRNQRGEVQHKLLSKHDAQPVIHYPVPKGFNKEGVIQVFEFPQPDTPYGINWGGVDIVRHAESPHSPSINVIYIYKGYNRLSTEFSSEKIVAVYKGRPKDRMDWYEQAMMLLEWYNAEALVENNVGWFIEETIKARKQNRISRTPQWLKEITPTTTAFRQVSYGVPMTDKLWDTIIDALVDYVSEVIHVTYDDLTGEPTEHYGVERIPDVFLLKEMIEFRPRQEVKRDNYDALIAFGLALLHANRQEMIGVVKEDEPEIVDFANLKNIKLLMKNSFLTSKKTQLLAQKLNKANYRR